MKTLLALRTVHVDTPVLLAHDQVFVLRFDDFIGWHAVYGTGVRSHCQQLIPAFQLVEFMARHSLVCADVSIDTDAELAAFDAARPAPVAERVVYFNGYF